MKRLLTLFAVFAVSASAALYAKDYELLNVSYDPTRELYEKYNEAFAKHYKAQTGDTVKINQSHGGSGKQALSVIDGLEADVVTLALAFDIDNIAIAAKLFNEDWQKEFPKNSTPYSSTVVFLVRKGNPKGIKKWEDLLKPGVEIVAANPKTSGVARWGYLAGWGYILKRELGDLKKLNDPKYATEVKAANEKAKAYTRDVYTKHVKTLASGARGASQSFIQQRQGDVLINWENEAYKAIHDKGGDKFEIITPPISILAEPPVAIVDKVVDRKGTRKVAEAYLNYLYSDEGQTIAGKNAYRPSNPKILKKFKDHFVDVELFSIDDVFGGWQKAQQEHFSDGGTYDQISE
ncbi:MAG: sulfate ABC transporter substrate-binding protein [Planctomycetaceae bacterium]|jgi:sulfate transport system substrate-binding protein|nr:sulfate ABC transporter substrate-binding protein [Planctomycetaceae bacterium]